MVNHKTDQLESNFSKPSFSIQEENWADKSSADKTSYRRLAFTSSATTRESNTDGKPINTTFDIEDASIKNTTKRKNLNMNVTFDLEDLEDSHLSKTNVLQIKMHLKHLTMNPLKLTL